MASLARRRHTPFGFLPASRIRGTAKANPPITVCLRPFDKLFIYPWVSDSPLSPTGDRGLVGQ